MKALDEYILMVLFVLLLKRVHFLVNVMQCKDVTTQIKRTIDECILTVLLLYYCRLGDSLFTLHCMSRSQSLAARIKRQFK